MFRGAIVLIPFPFDDFKSNKVRPAVCLTEPTGIHSHIVLAFISSRVTRDVLETDIILDSSHTDFAETGLHVSSTLRLHKLMTTTTDLLSRKLGTVSVRVQKEINRGLLKLFSLD